METRETDCLRACPHKTLRLCTRDACEHGVDVDLQYDDCRCTACVHSQTRARTRQVMAHLRHDLERNHNDLAAALESAVEKVCGVRDCERTWLGG